MKWLWSILVLLALPIEAQTTAVTATISDTSGQVWNNGSYTITFFPVPGKPGPYFYNGNPFSPQVYTGFMSNTGVLSISLPSNNFITPSGNLWTFTVCPQASSSCEAVNLSARWSTSTFYWRALTAAAARGDPRRLRRVQLFGLQLGAARLLP